MFDVAVFYGVGLAFIVVGIVVVVLAIIVASTRRTKDGKSETHAAGVIMIGPIPIIFGTDKKSVKTVMALALTLSVVALIVLLVYYWLLR
jgi:uncharacterized protein (TIGR00304 family)